MTFHKKRLTVVGKPLMSGIKAGITQLTSRWDQQAYIRY